MLPAPWTVKGKLTSEIEGTITYELELVFGVDLPTPHTMRFRGELGQEVPEPLSDAFELADWRVYEIGPYKRESGGSVIYDYGAQPVDQRYSNLGEVKAALRKSEEPQ